MAEEDPYESPQTESAASGSNTGTIVRWVIAVIGLLISGIFLANPGAGVFFEIPDNIPFVGNLDEVFFSGMFFYCLSLMGIDLLPRKKKAIELDRE